jgi:large subunit ribosomal protein L6
MLNRYIVKIPKNVEIFYCSKRQIILINGSFSKKSLRLFVKLEVCQHKNIIIVLDSTFDKLSNENKKILKSLRGTTMALLKQSFLEVSTLVCKKLNLIGVGYKAFPMELKNTNLVQLKLGYSHTIFFKYPLSINIKSPKTDTLFIVGNKLTEVSQTAALIRKFKAPEPYKGKGISYSNEIIKLKEGKKV